MHDYVGMFIKFEERRTDDGDLVGALYEACLRARKASRGCDEVGHGADGRY